jgi:hypothetical protein
MSDSKPSIQPQNDATNPNGQRQTMAHCATGFTPNGMIVTPNITLSPTGDGTAKTVEKTY